MFSPLLEIVELYSRRSKTVSARGRKQEKNENFLLKIPIAPRPFIASLSECPKVAFGGWTITHSVR